jgi:hypothetical protein
MRKAKFKIHQNHKFLFQIKFQKNSGKLAFPFNFLKPEFPAIHEKKKIN